MATELHRIEVQLIAPKDLAGLVPVQARARTKTAVCAFNDAVHSAGRSDVFIRGRSAMGVYVEATDDGCAFLQSLPQVSMVVPSA